MRSLLVELTGSGECLFGESKMKKVSLGKPSRISLYESNNLCFLYNEAVVPNEVQKIFEDVSSALGLKYCLRSPDGIIQSVKNEAVLEIPWEDKIFLYK